MRAANQIKPTLEKYCGRSSKWNGEIILSNENEKAGGKLWNCAIRLNSDAPIHALYHELVHSCSVSHFGFETYKIHRFEEELTVHYLSQELARLKKIPVVDSGYDGGVALIREFKLELNTKISDLEFASALLKEDLGYRWQWLAAQIPVNENTTFEQLGYFMTKLEEIKRWKPAS